MPSGKVLAAVVVTGIFAIAIQHIAKMAVKLGVFYHYYQHRPGVCRPVPGMPLASEDFYTLPDGLTFISSGVVSSSAPENFLLYLRQNNIQGRIFLWDLKFPDKDAKELNIVSTESFDRTVFSPHGISVWEDRQFGHHTIFVVNHPRKEPAVETVERFVYVPDRQKLRHTGTFSSPEMRSVNDVQATGDNSFYFTNSFYYSALAAIKAQLLLDLPWTNVVHYDGSRYTVAADGLKMANGIAMSVDKKYVYVADSGAQELLIFKRGKDNTLSLHQAIPLHTMPDNIEVDPGTGDLYIGCHPVPLTLMGYLEAPIGKISPSQVLHLRVREGNVTLIQQLLYDDGQMISASSSAIVYGNKLLVSSIIHTTIICDVTVPV